MRRKRLRAALRVLLGRSGTVPLDMPGLYIAVSVCGDLYGAALREPYTRTDVEYLFRAGERYVLDEVLDLVPATVEPSPSERCG